MKKLLLVLFLVACAVSGFSQEKKKNSSPNSGDPRIMVIPKKLYTPKTFDQLSGKPMDLRDQLTLLNKSGGPSSYSHSTPYGKVYKMRPSNMPCLVPDVTLNAKMPGSTPTPAPPSNMPGAQKPQKLIPDNK